MRAFIAIALPQQIKTALSQIQKKLIKTEADVKWVEPQNIHLTLKFLGEIDEKQQEQISQIIQEVASSFKIFRTNLTALGAFPDAKYPRVIWAGLDDKEKTLKDIAKELEERIEKLGIPKEDRPFAAHVTLGRVRSGRNRPSLTAGLNAGQEIDQSVFNVEKIALFKSTLSRTGPVYEAVYEASLKTT